MRNTNRSDLYHLTENIRRGIIGPCKFICELLLWIVGTLRRLLYSPEWAKFVDEESIIWTASHRGRVHPAITHALSSRKKKFHNLANVFVPEVDKVSCSSAVRRAARNDPENFVEWGTTVANPEEKFNIIASTDIMYFQCGGDKRIEEIDRNRYFVVIRERTVYEASQFVYGR
jgi:hypothetical protein